MEQSGCCSVVLPKADPAGGRGAPWVRMDALDTEAGGYIGVDTHRTDATTTSREPMPPFHAGQGSGNIVAAEDILGFREARQLAAPQRTRQGGPLE